LKSKVVVKLKKKKPEALPEHVAVYAEKGDRLLYQPAAGPLVECEVISVLQSIWPPSFMIKLADGQEKDTEANRVFSLKYAHAVVERIAMAASIANAKFDVLPASALQPMTEATAPSGGGGDVGGGGGGEDASTSVRDDSAANGDDEEDSAKPQKRRDEMDKKKKKKKK
jgi:hypothetical protein